MQPTLIEQGLMLMLVGMGTVVVFLTILVGGMSLMAVVVTRLQPVRATEDITDEEIAVISAALIQHRRQHH